MSPTSPQQLDIDLGPTGRPMPDGAELDEIPEKVVLVATELATNALRHGLPPTIVRLGRHDRVFVLDVADHSPDVVPRYADDRPPGAARVGHPGVAGVPGRPPAAVPDRDVPDHARVRQLGLVRPDEVIIPLN